MSKKYWTEHKDGHYYLLLILDRNDFFSDERIDWVDIQCWTADRGNCLGAWYYHIKEGCIMWETIYLPLPLEVKSYFDRIMRLQAFS